MAGTTTEHTKIVVETPLSLLRSQLSVFSELLGNGGGVAGGGRRFCGLVVIVVRSVVVVIARLLGVVGVVVSGSRSFAFLVGFVVGLVLGLVPAGTGLLTESFPVTGIDGVCESS